MGTGSQYSENNISQYICPHCNDKLVSENENATEYYRSVLKEVNAYCERLKNRKLKNDDFSRN